MVLISSTFSVRSHIRVGPPPNHGALYISAGHPSAKVMLLFQSRWENPHREVVASTESR